jgi:cytidyltransferase-like protein
MLSKTDLDNIQNWKYNVKCDDVVSDALNPFYNWIVKKVPWWIAPNVLSLAGLVCTIIAFFSMMVYGNFLVTAFFIACYMILDDIDGKHSRRIGNSSPLGELFDHFCDCISNVLITHSICYIILPLNLLHMPFIFLTTFSFMYEHYKAYIHPEKQVYFGKYTGPTALLTAVICLFTLLGLLLGSDPTHTKVLTLISQTGMLFVAPLLMLANVNTSTFLLYGFIGMFVLSFDTLTMIGMSIMGLISIGVGFAVFGSLIGTFVHNFVDVAFFTNVTQTFYDIVLTARFARSSGFILVMLLLAVPAIITLYRLTKMVTRLSFRNMIIVLLTVFINAFGLFIGPSQRQFMHDLTMWFESLGINQDLAINLAGMGLSTYYGIALSLLCAEFIISKMANRQLSAWVVVAQVMTVVFPPFGFFLAVHYFYTHMIEIATHMKLPILRTNVRVFVSGYYDKLHHGHINSLRMAKQCGDVLVVGVHSDKDMYKTKKKQPMVKANERTDAVRACEYVNEVISPCQLIFDEEFMIRNRITLIGVSDEYIKFKPDGSLDWIHESYQTAYDMGRYVIIPRTHGISSSAIREALNANVAGSVEPVVEPTEPVVEPTEPVVEQPESVVEPTELVVEPTESVAPIVGLLKRPPSESDDWTEVQQP